MLIGSAHGIYASSGTTLTLAMTKLNVKNNVLISGSHGFFANSDGSGSYSDVNVEGNDFTAASTAAFGGALITSCRIRNNKGYVSEKGGISSAIATGGTIAHGLAAQPGSYTVTPVGPATVTSVTADGTNLTVNYSGGGTAAFASEAKIPAYWT